MNIIGNEWTKIIGNVIFSIPMHKKCDLSKLGFSLGTFELTDNSKTQYYVSGNKITGSYDGILDVEKVLTVRCELLERYFVGVSFAFLE